MQRDASLDLLRGLAMVIMALDHARDFFNPLPYLATNLDRTTLALFLTRWSSHFCAPVFIFLAGTSVYLFQQRYGKSKFETARYLAIRGLWLIFLELTIVRISWYFDLSFNLFVFQVIWAIGFSMIVLAVLVYLPMAWIAGFGLAVVAGHNLFDGVRIPVASLAGKLWIFLHAPGVFRTDGGTWLRVAYPLVPWFGVIALGYTFGSIVKMDREQRSRWVVRIGLAAIALFAALRLSNFYGDPRPWTIHSTPLLTALSFINTTKYPPSLLFVLMTLGPSILFLSWANASNYRLGRALAMIGRVPLFFYLIHIPILHLLAVFIAYFSGEDVGWMFDNFMRGKPRGYAMGLPMTYFAWISVVAFTYPICKQYERLRSSHRFPILRFV